MWISRMMRYEMPNGEVLYVEYNKESDTLDVGQPTNAGLVAQHRFPYGSDGTGFPISLFIYRQFYSAALRTMMTTFAKKTPMMM